MSVARKERKGSWSAREALVLLRWGSSLSFSVLLLFFRLKVLSSLSGLGPSSSWLVVGVF